MPPGGTFYDIGSGSGRAVFAARFTQDFHKCIGIELMESLAKISFQVQEKYNNSFAEILSHRVSKTVDFSCDNFLDYDWSDGDVVFANSTCFDDALMEAIGNKAGALKPGAFLVTFTKGIKSVEFEQVSERSERPYGRRAYSRWISRNGYSHPHPLLNQPLNFWASRLRRSATR